MAGWHDPVPAMVTSTDASLVTAYPAYDRPMATTEVLRPLAASRVTLLGDAAHPMSMFKGQGANVALNDAVVLARYLSSVPELSVVGTGRFRGVPDALAHFEVDMLRRSEAKVRLSREAVLALHSPAALARGDCTRHAAMQAADIEG